mgnify:CR=1 FL=1
MTAEETFLDNLQIIEQLNQTAIIALTGKYLFNYQVKIYQVAAMGKAWPVAKISTLLRPPPKNKTFAAKLIPYDDSIWHELPNWDRDGRVLISLLEQLEDYKFYMTLEGGNVFYTFFGRYQVSGHKFEIATLKAVLLMCLVKKNILLRTEDLSCLEPELTSVDVRKGLKNRQGEYQSSASPVNQYHVKKSINQIKAERAARKQARLEAEKEQADKV